MKQTIRARVVVIIFLVAAVIGYLFGCLHAFIVVDFFYCPELIAEAGG